MGVAIWKVHFKNGLMGNGGYEFPLAVAAIAFALLCFDGGRGDLISGRAGVVRAKRGKDKLGRPRDLMWSFGLPSVEALG